jgi:hypothetical protein
MKRVMFSRDHGAACGGPFGLAQKNGPVGNEMEAYAMTSTACSSRNPHWPGRACSTDGRRSESNVMAGSVQRPPVDSQL